MDKARRSWRVRQNLAEADGNRTRPPAFTGALVLKTRRATRPQSPPQTVYPERENGPRYGKHRGPFSARSSLVLLA